MKYITDMSCVWFNDVHYGKIVFWNEELITILKNAGYDTVQISIIIKALNSHNGATHKCTEVKE